MKKPNRYSKDAAHRKYGITSWLKGKGIIDAEIQEFLINSFLEKKGFINPKTKVSEAKTAFIQARFNEFCSHALKQYNLPPKTKIISNVHSNNT